MTPSSSSKGSAKKHSKRTSKRQGSREKQPPLTSTDRWEEKFYVPCLHDGPCTPEKCDCIKTRGLCERFCHCSSYCEKQFTGCHCHGKCKSEVCPCVKSNRECDPGLCVTCNSGISQREMFSGQVRYMPQSSPLCRNMSIYYGKR